MQPDPLAPRSAQMLDARLRVLEYFIATQLAPQIRTRQQCRAQRQAMLDGMTAGKLIAPGTQDGASLLMTEAGLIEPA